MEPGATVFTRTPDVPLTDTGRRQVEAAGAWLAARYAPVRIVSSPFARARQSADILAPALGLPVMIEKDLCEQNYGALAGQPYAVLRSWPGYDRAAYWRWQPPGGGERLVEVAARAGAALDRVAGSAPDGDVVVVSHGGVMVALWWHVTGTWPEGGVARNAGMVEVEHREGAYLGARALRSAGETPP